MNPAGCALKLLVGTGVVVTLLGLVISSASRIDWFAERPWSLGLLGLLAFVIGVEVSTVVLSPKSGTPFNLLGSGGLLSRRRELSPEALVQRGEAARQAFRITRAVAVEDNGASGRAYFCQLEADAGVLLLTGQYLCDFEPLDEETGDEGEPIERRFPVTRFTTVRSTRDGQLCDLVPEGEVFEPERSFPCYPKGLYQKLDQLLDGFIWEDLNLDEIVALLGEPDL